MCVCMFQVFFSSYIFSANVMVKVATRPAENPVSVCLISSFDQCYVIVAQGLFHWGFTSMDFWEHARMFIVEVLPEYL